MKEILGGELDLAFKELEINAVKTYEGNTKLDDKTQIWEVDEEGFERLCDMNDDDWKENWGWWRSAEGSNMCNELDEYIINNSKIIAWDGNNRLAFEEENEDGDEDDRWWFPRKYSNLLGYLSEEIGASQPRNVCALVVDLANINNIKISELFRKCQG